MTKLRTLGAASALVVALGACADTSGTSTGKDFLTTLDAKVSSSGFAACTDEAKNIANNVNWATATTVNVDIRQGEFTPSTMSFDVGKAYVLKFTNRDNARRSFRAPEFFAASAMGQTKFGDKVSQSSCFTTLHFGPEESAEIQIVPQVDGRYRWHDNPAIFGPIFFRGTGFGTIQVYKG